MNKRVINLIIITLNLCLLMMVVYKDTKDRNMGMFFYKSFFKGV